MLTQRSTGATLCDMRRTVTQRELRNRSGGIMRALDRGEVFLVTRNGVPVGELRPPPRRVFVLAAEVRAAFRLAPALDRERLRRDVDRFVDQDPTPRG
jgi:antitoxin (DNA-binding transcriptional repressor) of toxin-antitoxin stability system